MKSIFRQLTFTLVAFFAFSSCNETNQDTLDTLSCEGLVNGVYEFPSLPANHGMSQEGITEFWQIPEGILDCISTEGLIISNLNYPNAGMILASSSSIQNGYGAFVRSRFNGAAALESRSDRGTALVDAYKKVDPLAYGADWTDLEKGKFSFGIMYLELIIGQYANLDAMTRKEKQVLVKALLKNLDKKNESEVHGTFGQTTTTAVLMRMMKNDKFSPFMQVYDSDSAAWGGLEGFMFASDEMIASIQQFSLDYLKTLQ